MRDFRNIIFILIIITFLTQMFLMKQDAKRTPNVAKPTVAVSTFALYDIVKHLAKESVNVVMILPFGVDAHSFEPTPKLMTKIYKSDLVLYNGAGLEPWIDGFAFKNRVVNISKFVQLQELSKEHHHHEKYMPEHTLDPHYWLDMQNMIKATTIITKELVKISPQQEKFYKNNMQEYIDMLHTLDKSYKQELSTCKRGTIFVNHNAFSYLSSRYHFNVESLNGLSPDAQPSGKSMAKIVEHIKDENISTIFFESFASDKAIKTVANESSVAVDKLQPLGNITAKEAQQNLSYEDIMRENLHKISKALECN